MLRQVLASDATASAPKDEAVGKLSEAFVDEAERKNGSAPEEVRVEGGVVTVTDSTGLEMPENTKKSIRSLNANSKMTKKKKDRR